MHHLGSLGGKYLSEVCKAIGTACSAEGPREKGAYTTHVWSPSIGSTHFFCKEPDVLGFVTLSSVTYYF